MTAGQVSAQAAYPPANNSPATAFQINGGPRGRITYAAAGKNASLQLAQQPPAPAAAGQFLPAPGDNARLPEDIRPSQPPTGGTATLPGARSPDDMEMDDDMSEWGPDSSRLPLMMGDVPSGLGRTPQPTPKQRADYDRFFAGIIDAEATLDLIQGFPRLLVFKEAPCAFRSRTLP